MAQINIPVEILAQFKTDPSGLQKLYKEISRGNEKAIKDWSTFTGQKAVLETKMEINNKGEWKKVQQETVKGVKEIQKAYAAENRAQSRSVTSLKKKLSNLRQQQDAVNKYKKGTDQLTKSWQKFENKIKSVNKELAKQQSGYKGMLARGGKAGETIQKALNFMPQLRGLYAGLEMAGEAFQRLNQFAQMFISRQKQIQNFERTMKAFGETNAQAAKRLERAKNISLRYGVSLNSIEKGMKRLLPTIKAMGGTAGDTDVLVKALALRSSMLGLNAEQSGRNMEAFAQVMSKGKLQAEELNQQFAELDGQLRNDIKTFVQAKLGIQDFEKAMRDGMISASTFAQAYVEATRKMAKEVGDDLDNVFTNFGKLNATQFEQVINTLNTIGIENLGNAFIKTGEYVQEFQVTMAAAFASISESSFFDDLGGLVAGITKALTFLTEAVLVATKGFADWYDVLNMGLDELGEVGEIAKMALNPIEAANYALSKAGVDLVQVWRDVKAAAFGVADVSDEVEMKLSAQFQTQKSLIILLQESEQATLKGTVANREYSAQLEDVVQQLLETGKATADTSAKIGQYAREIVLAHNSLVELNNSTSGSIQSAASLTASQGRLASTFHNTSRSATETKVAMQGNLDTMKETLKQLEKTRAAVMASVNAGRTLTQQEQAALDINENQITTLKELISTQKGNISTLEKAVKIRGDHASKIKDELKAMETYLDKQEQAAAKAGRYSKEARTFVKNSVDTANAMRAEAAALEKKNAAILKSAGGMKGLTVKQLEMVQETTQAAAAFRKSADEAENAADKYRTIFDASGNVSKAFAQQYNQVTKNIGRTDLNTKQQQALNQSYKDLSNTISGELKAAEQEREALIKRSMQQQGGLTQKDRQYLGVLNGVISKLKGYQKGMKKAKKAKADLGGEVKRILTPTQKYIKALKEATKESGFQIKNTKNLLSNLKELGTGFSGVGDGARSLQSNLSSMSGGLQSTKTGMDAVTNAISSQESKLKGYVNQLTAAKLAGFQLTDAQEALLQKSIKLTEQLGKEKEAREAAAKEQSSGKRTSLGAESAPLKEVSKQRGAVQRLKIELDGLVSQYRAVVKQDGATSKSAQDLRGKIDSLKDSMAEQTDAFSSGAEAQEEYWSKAKAGPGLQNWLKDNQGLAKSLKEAGEEMGNFVDGLDDYVDGVEEAAELNISESATRSVEEIKAAQSELSSLAGSVEGLGTTSSVPEGIDQSLMGYGELSQAVSDFNRADEAYDKASAMRKSGMTQQELDDIETIRQARQKAYKAMQEAQSGARKDKQAEGAEERAQEAEERARNQEAAAKERAEQRRKDQEALNNLLADANNELAGFNILLNGTEMPDGSLDPMFLSQMQQVVDLTQGATNEQKRYREASADALNAILGIEGATTKFRVGTAEAFQTYQDGSLSAAESVINLQQASESYFRSMQDGYIDVLKLQEHEGKISEKMMERKIKQQVKMAARMSMAAEETIRAGQQNIQQLQLEYNMKKAINQEELVASAERVKTLEGELSFENAILNQINQRVQVEKTALDEQVAKVETVRDTKLEAIDREMEKADMAHEAKMSDLDGELEKVRAISNERIAELEAATPAEKELARLQEKKLKQRAKDSSLSKEERLQAEAQLERMERDKKIAEEREKLKEQEKKIQAEIDKLTQDKAEADLAFQNDRAKAEYAYQRSVTAFTNAYDKKVREMLEYQMDAKKRIAALDEQMFNEVLDQERTRDEGFKLDDSYNKQINEAVDELETSLSQMAEKFNQVGSRLAGKTQQQEIKLQDYLHAKRVKAHQEREKMMEKLARDELARQMAMDDEKDRKMRDRRAYELNTIDLIIRKWNNMKKGPITGPNRFAGGSVAGGSTYTVNELGKEGFLSASGMMKEIKAPAFGQWKAPSSGTVIPADIWSQVKASQPTHAASAGVSGYTNSQGGMDGMVKAIAGLAGGSRDNITNNVSIQSQQPIQAASDMLVEMTKLRRSRFR